MTIVFGSCHQFDDDHFRFRATLTVPIPTLFFILLERQRPKTTAEEIRGVIEKLSERDKKKEDDRAIRHTEKMAQLKRFIDIYAAVNKYDEKREE